MNEMKLAKLVDAIVKRRIKEIVKSNKEIKIIIREEVKSQLIKILLENKIDITKKSTKRTTQISELLNSKRSIRYPKIKKSQAKRMQVEERRLTKDPVLNKILNATPYVKDSGGGFTGNALMDSMGGTNNESLQYAQSVASGLGSNVSVDINKSDVAEINTVPNNAELVSSKQTPQLKEYRGDDGFYYVDDRMLFENEGGAQAGNIQAPANLERAMSKNYKELLSKMDEKAQKYRNK